MPPKKRKKRKKSTGNEFKRWIWIITLFIVIIVTGVIFYLDYLQFKNGRNAIFQKLYTGLNLSHSVKPRVTDHVEPENMVTQMVQPVPDTPKPYQEETHIPTQSLNLNNKNPKVAIIIDDMGNNTGLEKQFLQLKWRLSFAVIPNLGHSREIAVAVNSRNRDVLLHMPMEPIGYPETDPGNKPLLVSLSHEENRLRLLEALNAVPHVVGINNHMGSRFTQDYDQMKNFLQELQHQALFFIDSRTTAESIAYDLAIQMKIPVAKRDVFLDHTDDYNYICDQLRHLAALAKSQGKSLGIGHPRLATLRSLRDILPEFDQEMIRVVSVSEFVEE
ncbi:MAG: hypothetical protein A2161_10600 [Candidatus Schekmanbacteria bacterium RBG_13_48_7]|uniref:Divergent polysaccharide deacetylase family protein n=1 Tax=Candidatus Schekmanbacteria bacterium RBG_13_48_7 TaxID=1817878 RepID=A0A1F7RX71_9BACT|nr:MAG: hypothetical protein A2161_10600 [Candidatus Schekmanbacteria bacterium RBG_13_48_7]